MANKLGNWLCAYGAQNDMGLIYICVCQLARSTISSLNEVREVVGHNVSSNCVSDVAKNLLTQVCWEFFKKFVGSQFTSCSKTILTGLRILQMQKNSSSNLQN